MDIYSAKCTIIKLIDKYNSIPWYKIIKKLHLKKYIIKFHKSEGLTFRLNFNN